MKTVIRVTKNHILQKPLKCLKNDKGIALMMVMSMIVLLTFILTEIGFETSLNSIRVTNLQDKIQARLNAESGIKFALAKLKLYQAGINLLEKNKNLKDIVGPDKLESIIAQPFIFPISLPKNTNIIQRTALEEFEENMVVQGSLSVEISSVSGFMNPNNLRISKKKKDDSQKETPEAYIEKELVNLLTSAIEAKKEEDEDFLALYGDLDPSLLIKELKYFVSSPSKFTDPEKAEIELLYEEQNITPKHAPLTSISELYLLAGWDDAIVDLIKDRLTVFQTTIIHLNKITTSQLKVLFPSITKEQLEAFFQYRDGASDTPEGEERDEEDGPHPFTSISEFKKVIVEDINIVSEGVYTKRIKEFANAGLRLGVAGKLFQVISSGQYNNAQYNLKAFIDLPVMPEPPAKKKSKKRSKPEPSGNDSDAQENDEEGLEPENSKSKPAKKKKEKKIELMEPRIVEIIRT